MALGKNLFRNPRWAQYGIKPLLAKLNWNKSMFKQLRFPRAQEIAVQKNESPERLNALYVLPWEQVIHMWEWITQPVVVAMHDLCMKSKS